MAHLDSVAVDAEYGFLETLTRWLSMGATLHFSRFGDLYLCEMTYKGVTHETNNKTLFGALKIAAGKHNTDILYGAET